jgi:phage-related protein
MAGIVSGGSSTRPSNMCGFLETFLANMSNLTYYSNDERGDKLLVWLHGEVKTPLMSREARIEAGFLLRRLQQGELLSMPQSRPMPSIGASCHELRIVDTDKTWRVIYRIDTDAIVILEVFSKKTRETPQNVIDACKRRIKIYDSE